VDQSDNMAPGTPEGPERSSARLSFRRPADYYSTPVGDARPLFPRWVPYGCGTASIIVLLLVFALGAAVSAGGLGQVLDLMIGTMQGEIDKMFTSDVKPQQREAFDAEMKTMRAATRENHLSLDRLQPLLRSMRDASVDEHITPEETEQLTRELRDVNSSIKH
jgi:hypothetical protein